MDISIIIPTYKPQNYIYECLDSIRNQTFPYDDFEVVLVLNGCSEPYYSYLTSYITENLSDLNIELIQTDVPGVSNARNIGIDNSKGDYIIFIDDDDIVSESFLSGLYEYASRDCVSLSNMAAFRDGSNEPVCDYISDVFNRWHKSDKVNIFRVRSYFSIPVSKMIHRSIIGDIRFNAKFTNGEDGLFMFEVSKNIKSVCFSKEDAIYNRRVRDVSLSNSIGSEKLYIIKNGFALMSAYTRVFIGGVPDYNIIFFVLRILAVVKWMTTRLIFK